MIYYTTLFELNNTSNSDIKVILNIAFQNHTMSFRVYIYLMSLYIISNIN